MKQNSLGEAPASAPNPSAADVPAEAPPNPADDPALADLLAFEPVVRKVKRPDGWTPELQREFIARLARSGSPQQACTEMGKNVTGIQALYKVPAADSFRAAWDEALAIGRTAQGLDAIPPHAGPVPGIQHRPLRGIRRETAPDDDWGEEDEDGGFELRHTLLNMLIAKFIDKVRQEREARLGGDVPAADYYLRQITCLEVGLDLMAEGLGMSGLDALIAARRGDYGVLQIAGTEMSRILDGARRMSWEQMDEPPRPEHPPRRYLEELTGIAIEPLQAFGPASRPPPGITQEDWSKLSHAGQHLAVNEIRDAEVEAQLKWERGSTASKTKVGTADTSACSRDAEPDRPTTGEAVSIDVTNSVRDGPSSRRKRTPRIRSF